MVEIGSPVHQNHSYPRFVRFRARIASVCDDSTNMYSRHSLKEWEKAKRVRFGIELLLILGKLRPINYFIPKFNITQVYILKQFTFIIYN